MRYLDEIKIAYQYTGSNNLLIDNFCALSEPKPNCITWIKKVDSYDFSNKNSFKMLFVTCRFDKKHVDDSYNIIESDDPKQTYFEILKYFFATPDEPKIEASSIIKTNCIGKNVSIGYHCFIGKDVTIGDNVIIKNNVVIECPAKIGNNTIICSGVVIGTDGFGYFQKDDGISYKTPHFGGVKIGENVEVGANTCIDRGTLGDTIIGNNVKIDNLCHIAHNVNIEDNVMIIASVMLGGSCVLKRGAYIAPGAVILNQLTIEKDALVGIGAVVIKNVEENTVVVGNPARAIRKNKKAY